VANSLFPAFIRIFEHSANASHVRTVPTLLWTPPTPGNDFGTFDTWNAGSIQAEDQVTDLVTQLKEFVPSTYHFDSAIIYTMADETADPLPRISIDLGVAGTGDPGVPACQGTYTWRTSEFGLLKVVILDGTPTTDFLPFTVEGAPGGQPRDLGDLLRDDDHGFAGRDGGQVTSFLRATFTLNESLRREYHFT